MTESQPELCPERAEQRRFAADVLAGLSQRPPSIPCKYFYDLTGSRLFDRITEQPEYYPTRAETELLHAHAGAIARALGRRVDLIELGSGSSIKTRLLLDALEAPSRYVPIDISAEHLRATAKRLAQAYPDLRIEPVVGDYGAHIDGVSVLPQTRRVVFFPGSSIGNFEPDDAVAFLRRARTLAGPTGVLLVGVDLPKSPATLERAYDDPAGYTAQFNLNLLVRMQRELGAELTVSDFRHAAVWQPERSRIEMRLVATRRTSVTVDRRRFEFGDGEWIVTEHCYKHDVDAFGALARRAGLVRGRVWLDPGQRVSMHWLDVEADSLAREEIDA